MTKNRSKRNKKNKKTNKMISTPAPSTTTSVVTPPLATLSLSNELWLEIFKYFSFVDLKRCVRVSKHFQSLTEHASLNAVLCRSQTLSPGPPALHHHMHEVEIHGVFYKLQWDCTPDLDKCYLLVRNRPYKVMPLKDHPVAHEPATYPPTRLLRLDYSNWAPFEVNAANSDSCITVLDVIQATVDFFDSRRINNNAPHSLPMLGCGHITVHDIEKHTKGTLLFRGFDGHRFDHTGELNLRMSTQPCTCCNPSGGTMHDSVARTYEEIVFGGSLLRIYH